MQGERPLPPASSHFPGTQPVPSLQLHNDGADAALKLPLNTELNISIRYNREPTPGETQPLSKSPLYMKYAVDYRLMSNLRVGLNSYLYRPSEEGFPFQHSLANPLVGVGPELKYDSGAVEFPLKEPGGEPVIGTRAKTCKTGSGSGTPSSDRASVSCPHKTNFPGLP